MPYGDEWERETRERVRQWQRMRWRREVVEERLHPDKRLDEVGWDIYYCATRVMNEDEAAALALDGKYRQRLAVRKDQLRSHRLALEKRYAELHPNGPGFGVFETTAPEQLAFWRERLREPSFIYFIQSGEDGPIKIGLSHDPTKRLPQLQTGNHVDLRLRHVIPGDLGVEQTLHERFEPARIRGEWFGLEYLPVIITFAGGLADRMVSAYDDSGVPPQLVGGDVRAASELDRIRADIERMWLAGHDEAAIAEFTWLAVNEVEQQLSEMRQGGLWDVQRRGGFDLRDGRIVAYRSSRPKRKAPRRSDGGSV
jgi:hypothetical protein